MADPTGAPTSAAKEPSTKLGNFYRAHRPEVLAAGGVVVAAVAYWRSKHPSSSSSSSSTSTTIDPATGYPTGSAADEAALAAQSSAASGGLVATAPTSDLSGYQDGGGGTGYSGSGGYGSQIESTLTSIQSELAGDTSIVSPPTSVTSTPPSTGDPTDGNSPEPIGGVGAITATDPTGAITGAATPQPPTAQQTATLSKLNTELTKDEAGSTAGDKASVTTLKKQIAAVQARS